MHRPLRIAVADDERDVRDFFREFLPPLGHTVVGTAADGRELIDLCRKEKPDLIIADIKMPETDGIDAARVVYRERPVPVILVSAYHDTTLLARAEAEHVLAYLVKPIKAADLAPAIGVATKRFEEFQALRQEADDLRQALEDRKVIERAKGVLMKRAGLEEAEAFRRMQKLASEKSRKLADIAAMILVAEEAAQPAGVA